MADPQPQAKALSAATTAAIREQLLTFLSDPEVQDKLREIVGQVGSSVLEARPAIEVGAAEAAQIMDLIEKQIGPILDKRIEKVVRGLIRPDYLLRPHLRPENVEV